MKANKKNKIKVTSRAGRKEERTAYLCLIPAFLGVSLISYLPTLAVFVLSVFKWNGLSSPEFVGLENFQRIFTKDIYFADSIKATILYALLAVVGAIIYSLLVALLLNMKIWGRTLFRSVFFIPYLCPSNGVTETSEIPGQSESGSTFPGSNCNLDKRQPDRGFPCRTSECTAGLHGSSGN